MSFSLENVPQEIFDYATELARRFDHELRAWKDSSSPLPAKFERLRSLVEGATPHSDRARLAGLLPGDDAPADPSPARAGGIRPSVKNLTDGAVVVIVIVIVIIIVSRK